MLKENYTLSSDILLVFSYNIHLIELNIRNDTNRSSIDTLTDIGLTDIGPIDLERLQ